MDEFIIYLSVCQVLGGENNGQNCKGGKGCLPAELEKEESRQGAGDQRTLLDEACREGVGKAFR